MTLVGPPSVVLCDFNVSWITNISRPPFPEQANLDSTYAREFCSLGTWTRLNVDKVLSRSLHTWDMRLVADPWLDTHPWLAQWQATSHSSPKNIELSTPWLATSPLSMPHTQLDCYSPWTRTSGLARSTTRLVPLKWPRPHFPADWRIHLPKGLTGNHWDQVGCHQMKVLPWSQRIPDPWLAL